MAAKLRDDLRSSVRGLWTSEGFDVQESLKAKGRELLKEAYKKCAVEGAAKDFKKCLYDVAKAKSLADEYRGIWGTK